MTISLDADRDESPDDACVVILGAGFGGLAAARELGRRNVQTVIVDHRNYHLFQPLLYQVATAALSPAEISEPTRKILRRYESIRVMMDEVTGIDRERRVVRLSGGREMRYGQLIVATGATHSYFGRDEWRWVAPGLKSISDATAIRAKLLSAFERAEISENEGERRRLMTFVIVGGGPTGVEMAGSIAELARHALARDFRMIDPKSARVILIEGGPRLLSGFDSKLGTYAEKRLGRLGVEVVTGKPVEHITPAGVFVDQNLVEADTVIWAAGVSASPVGQFLGVRLDKVGRVPVRPDLSIEGDADVFVIGDLARFETADGAVLPGLAQVAKQQGIHLGRALAGRLQKGTPLSAFQYKPKGNAAIIGRHAAIFETSWLKLSGWFAWLLWAIVHVFLLVGFRNRVIVSLQWLWRYLTSDRGARLIVERIPGEDGPVPDAERDPRRTHLVR